MKILHGEIWKSHEDTSSLTELSPSNLLFDRKGIISEFINTQHQHSSFQSSQVWKVCSGNLIMSSAQLSLVSIPINKDIQQRIEEGENERGDKVWKSKISFSDFNIYHQANHV